MYTEPLYRVEHAVEVGFALLKPRLSKWVYGRNRRIILIGDAAHPPVPYVGQGAQMGIEDAGTLCLILKELCLGEDGELDIGAVGNATRIYENIRIPRASRVLEASRRMGSSQTQRATGNKTQAKAKEHFIKNAVLAQDTLPLMFPGSKYNYSKDVSEAIAMQSKHACSSSSHESPPSILEETLRMLEHKLPPAPSIAGVDKLPAFADLLERFRRPASSRYA